MPFDGTTSTPALNRARLIGALRNDKTWRWNFCRSSGCAIGMAAKIWPDVKFNGSDPLATWLGLTAEQCLNIFGIIPFFYNEARGLPLEWSDYYQMCRTDVTPQMVADALERV